MEEKKIDPFFTELIQKALEGEATPFELISSSSMHTATKVFARATKKVIKMFKTLVQTTCLKYQEQIQTNSQDLQVLLAYVQFNRCVEFYEQELKTAKSMLQEYRAYVTGGHMLKTLLGIPRSEYDMVDYRTLPWRLF